MEETELIKYVYGGLILILILLGIVFAHHVRSVITLHKKTAKLFEEVLKPVCYASNTISDIKNAREMLDDECLNPDGGMFKLYPSYLTQYIELRAILKGKEFILEKNKKEKI